MLKLFYFYVENATYVCQLSNEGNSVKEIDTFEN